jgi:hypothetical protein
VDGASPEHAHALAVGHARRDNLVLGVVQGRVLAGETRGKEVSESASQPASKAVAVGWQLLGARTLWNPNSSQTCEKDASPSTQCAFATVSRAREVVFARPCRGLPFFDPQSDSMRETATMFSAFPAASDAPSSIW